MQYFYTLANESLPRQSKTATLLLRKAFAPLPVLGVPGWWAANEDPAFYGQTQVFRLATTAATDKFS